MMNYADYGFYIETYKGSLSNDLFNSLIVKASREIDRNVNCDITIDVIDNLRDIDKYKLQYVACELVDYFNENGTNASGGRASSISIDGVSINKGNSSDSQLMTSKKNIINNLPNELVRYI